jgi:hypothetical protein
VIFGFKNPSGNRKVNYRTRLHPYFNSETDYNLVQLRGYTDSGDIYSNTYNSLTTYSGSYLKPYLFAPKSFHHDYSITRTPLRFLFQTDL